MNGNTILKAIKLIYPQIEGGYSFWENHANPSDGLVWENTQYPKPDWEDIQALIPQIELQEAKEAKLAQLKVNLDNESKKPFSLIGVKQIDKDGKVIKTVNAFYNIQDVNSLTDSANIIFAGSIMIIQATIKLLCEANKIDFEAIRTQVNALSDSSNPAIAFKNNIPYTTKDVENKEIRVLLSYQKIQEIFAHIFTRVATKTNLFNIIEEKIKKATSIEELDKIDINLN